jgi:apolipoprotein D and lipocalin family protein
MLQTIKLFLLSTLLMLSSFSFAQIQEEIEDSEVSRKKIEVVDYVDINKYLGSWYEIASIPQWFSKKCVCTKANYSLTPKGNIRVINTCLKNSINGKVKRAKGIAKLVDKKTNAKLKVSFIWPFYGGYWIIALGNDYQYAVVSNKEGSSLWILSRTPELAPELYDEAMAKIKENEINIDRLKMTRQQDCPAL